MNPIKNFRHKTPDEKNGIYINTIAVCVLLVVILLFTSLAISYNSAGRAAELSGGTDADSAMNEIRSGLLVKSEDSLSGALSYVETYYATTPSEKRSELTGKKFVKLFYAALKKKAGVKTGADEELITSGSDRVYRVAVPEKSSRDVDDGSFEKYLESLADEDLKASVAASGKHMYIAYSKTDDYVELQNVKVSCADGSEVTADIRFRSPDGAAGDSEGTYAGTVNTYAAVADGDITSTGGNNRLTGSAYSGGSINAQAGGSLDIDGSETVARGDLTSSGSALLNILQGEVWAKNLKTLRSDSSASGQGTGIEIKGDCYVAGDLLMENPGYAVDIYGNYYGYGTTDEDDDDSGTSVKNTDSSVSGTETDTILRRLLSGNYRMLTNSDGTVSSLQQSTGSVFTSSGGSTISISGYNAGAHIAYGEGQVLWLAATGYYGKAADAGRAVITETTIPAGQDSDDTDSNRSNREMLYSNQYNGLISGLDKNFSSSEPTYKLASHLLKTAGIGETNVVYTPDENGVYQPHSLSEGSSSAGKYVTISPRSGFRTGIVIADCDVHIVNVNFTGTIITTGDIVLGGGASVTSDPGTVRFTALAENSGNKAASESDGRVEVTFRNVK